ncbi:hypothetical protein C2G38_2106732 [Gigaspora rosea]|uniref:Uncharacterized protein n=1 Tax=Gigaspora rosea TaxID=44941 RepID=A0A397UM13_9GLOM|nr:hypothetical protein C2G38_2106732 [Gigaspora rosea]
MWLIKIYSIYSNYSNHRKKQIWVPDSKQLWTCEYSQISQIMIRIELFESRVGESLNI